jgi:NitT/TauT family transport system permease protein
LLIEYARQITSQPAKVYVAVFGAIALGLLVAALVTALDVYLTRNLPKEKNA